MKINNVLAVAFILVFSSSIIAQNQRADGFKGIWFGLGQIHEYGDKYSGGLGTYTSSHVPVAIYSKKAKKTFFVYGGTTEKEAKHLLIMISYFDHKTKKVAKPVIVYDKMGVDDPHDDASVQIDEDGFVWVFVSGRGTGRKGIIFKGTEPFSIRQFEKVLVDEMTYPQPWWIKGKGFMFLFTKYTNGRELYWSTSADGRSWAPHQKFAGIGGHYQVSNLCGNKLVSVFNYHPNGDVDKRTNLYVVQTEDMGITWSNVAGKSIIPPLSEPHNDALVINYEAEGKVVYINDLNFDKDGNPIILAIVSRSSEPGPPGDPREWVVINWKNNKWNFRTVSRSTHNYDMGSLYADGKTWRIIGPTQPGPQHYGTGGEMAGWISRNEGKTWKLAKSITKNSLRNHSYARRPLNAHKDFYAFWADGNADAFSASELYFTNRKGNKVWVLPYDMEAELEKPKRYK